jgi:hypothetical protein
MALLRCVAEPDEFKLECDQGDIPIAGLMIAAEGLVAEKTEEKKRMPGGAADHRQSAGR